MPGQAFMDGFEVMLLEPFRDPAGDFQDFLRFLRSLDALDLPARQGRTAAALAVALFQAGRAAGLEVPLARGRDLQSGS